MPYVSVFYTFFTKLSFKNIFVHINITSKYESHIIITLPGIDKNIKYNSK